MENDTKVENVVNTPQLSFTIKSKLYFTEKEVTVTDAEYAGPGVISKPTIVVKDGGKVLEEGKDYTVTLDVNAALEPSSKEYNWEVTGKGVYADQTGNKNQLTTQTTYQYLDQGIYYAYCHAWKRVDGKKVFSEWSNIMPFSVSSITPSKPVITDVTTSKNTVTVTYTKSANATGYDLVLGNDMMKVNGEMRPVNYGKLVKKVYSGNTVKATFTKVPKGTYYVGLHAYNRTSEDGKKVFSPWSNAKKITVK